MCWIERQLEIVETREEERAEGGRGFEKGGSEGRRGVCWIERQLEIVETGLRVFYGVRVFSIVCTEGLFIYLFILKAEAEFNKTLLLTCRSCVQLNATL